MLLCCYIGPQQVTLKECSNFQIIDFEYKHLPSFYVTLFALMNIQTCIPIYIHHFGPMKLFHNVKLPDDCIFADKIVFIKTTSIAYKFEIVSFSRKNRLHVLSHVANNNHIAKLSSCDIKKEIAICDVPWNIMASYNDSYFLLHVAKNGYFIKTQKNPKNCFIVIVDDEKNNDFICQQQQLEQHQQQHEMEYIYLTMDQIHAITKVPQKAYVIVTSDVKKLQWDVISNLLFGVVVPKCEQLFLAQHTFYLSKQKKRKL